MKSFEYKILDLNSVARRQTLLDVLNDEGAMGWELISISRLNTGIFKRVVGDVHEGHDEDDDHHDHHAADAPGSHAGGPSADDVERLRQEMEAIARAKGLSLGDILDGNLLAKAPAADVKFQDPARPENTWSGRGRMPKWLAKAIADGNSKDAYRVRTAPED